MLCERHCLLVVDAFLVNFAFAFVAMYRRGFLVFLARRCADFGTFRNGVMTSGMPFGRRYGLYHYYYANGEGMRGA